MDILVNVNYIPKLSHLGFAMKNHYTQTAGIWAKRRNGVQDVAQN